METKDWYKLTFLIESDSEEIIIWKLNELGIFSFSFEYLIKNENKKEVNIWLPVDDWGENSRCGFEKIISKLLNINAPKDQFFEYMFIDSGKIVGVLGNEPPVLTTREELKIEAAREVWKKLIAQGWRKTPVVW